MRRTSHVINDASFKAGCGIGCKPGFQPGIRQEVVRMRRLGVLIAAVALAMGVAACSSSGSSTSGSGNTAGASGQVSAYKDHSNPNLPPIKVGMIAPIGTANSNLPELRAGLAAGILGVNSRGGLNGHRVVMVFC